MTGDVETATADAAAIGSRERRRSNGWAKNTTLEDYSLRYAPKSFQRWTPSVCAMTALGGIAYESFERPDVAGCPAPQRPLSARCAAAWRSPATTSASAQAGRSRSARTSPPAPDSTAGAAGLR
jgi:hypothetical protein